MQAITAIPIPMMCIGNFIMQNNTINYIEFPMLEKAKTMQFYSRLFNWEFTEWGEDYISFAGAGIDGGFNGVGDATSAPIGILIVLYVDDLEQKLHDVANAGGIIVKQIFAFPGGRRFHFKDPNNNELAAWSK